MEERFLLGATEKHLWTRERAREMRSRLESMLDARTAGDTVVIDGKGVEVFDFSFANEFFGKAILGLSREYPGRFLIVENLTEYTRENLVSALEALGLAMIERKGRTLQLIGRVRDTDRETFNAIVKAKEPITATALKDQLNVNLTAMNERLAKLSNLGIVRRRKGTSAAGREQYEYTVLA